MKSLSDNKPCPRCHLQKMKSWEELDFAQRILAEKLPLNTEFSPSERKKHLFCTNCWNEEIGQEIFS